MFIDSFDIAVSTIGQDTDYFSLKNIQSFEKLAEMKEICHQLDEIANQLNSTGFSFKINENDMTYSVTIICPGINIKAQDQYIWNLFSIAQCVSFKCDDDGNVVLCLKFEGIWK